MKRESAMYRIKDSQKNTLINVLWSGARYIDEACSRLGLKNVSAWSVGDFLYLYGEHEDEGTNGLTQLTDSFADELGSYAELISAPGDMRLMYHCIGVVRQDKRLIRRRVFATVLKDGCADEYYARHKKLIDARGDEVPDGPETNFTICCALNKYIFGYCELVKSYDHEPSEEEKAATAAWETRQLEIMDWLTDDVDWLTGETHEKMKNLYQQTGY
ncbi:MAG: hypothetical protein II920_02490 [Clostridia bacterium]|nr:hypothetical protein [Clostridia bacterium]